MSNFAVGTGMVPRNDIKKQVIIMEIKIFSNSKFGQLRVALNEKGETVFCLADVCKALAIGNTSDVKRRLDGAAIDPIEVCLTSVNQYGAKSVRTTKMTYIGEPNLYRCIFQSKKEEAREFQDWVFNTVLPQIRKTGGYIPVTAEDDEKTILARALTIAQRTLEEKERLIELQRPMAELGCRVTGAEENIMVGEMAKLLFENGIDIGRQRLFDWLRENGYIFKQSREPMQKWVERGIMTVRECWVTTNHGTELSVTPMITGKGQEYFLNLFCGGRV